MKSHRLTLPTPASANGVGARARSESADGQSRSPVRRRIRLVLADDHPVVRRGLAIFLQRCPNLEVVAEAADGQEALCKARELKPDVLLTDVDMPRLTGLAVTETLRKELPTIKVLLLSTNDNSEFVVRCVRSGAQGYILKQASPDEFVQAIETVNTGQPFFSPDLARAALNQMVQNTDPGPDAADLTPREREVLSRIAEGLCNKEIACSLNIGIRTVETHRERLMRKLNIHSIAGLTRFAIAKGLVHCPEVPAVSR